MRHLCPSNVALLWVARAVCPVGRRHNTGRNQLHPHACLATNKNREGCSIACPIHNAQGNHMCPPAVMHGPRVGVMSTQRSGKLAVAGSRTCSSSPHAQYTSPSYLRWSASSTSMGNQPVQRWSMRGQS